LAAVYSAVLQIIQQGASLFPAAGTDCTCCHGNGPFPPDQNGTEFIFFCLFIVNAAASETRAKNNATCHRVVKDAQLSS